MAFSASASPYNLPPATSVTWPGAALQGQVGAPECGMYGEGVGIGCCGKERAPGFSFLLLLAPLG